MTNTGNTVYDCVGLRKCWCMCVTATYCVHVLASAAYLHQEGYVFAFVGLSVSRIIQKVSRNLADITGGRDECVTSNK